MLHDTVEDTDTTEEELRAVFGSEVTGKRSYVTEMCCFGYGDKLDFYLHRHRSTVARILRSLCYDVCV